MSQDEKEPQGADENSSGADTTSGGPEERMDLPKWNRARVKRKTAAGEGEDAFTGGVRQAGRFTIERAPLVLLGIVAISGIIAGVQWFRGWQQAQRAEATRLLANAAGNDARGVVEDVEALTKDRKHPFPIPLFDDEEKKEQAVRAALSEIEEKAPNSAANVAAELVRAGQLMEDRMFAEAQGIYTSFLERHPGHELGFLAHEGVVLALEGQGKPEEALAATDPLVGREGDFYRDQGLWHRARLQEALGQQEDAISTYKTYAAEYPLGEPSVARQEVLERVEEVAPDLVPAQETTTPENVL